MTLTFADFKKKREDTQPYYSHVFADKTEICLEPCLEGFDVGLYDSEQRLLRSKTCTKSAKEPEAALRKALRLANRMIKK